jgi:hypothetical protein
MTKAEIEAALSALETWIQVFGVLVAIGIVGEVAVGLRHWILNRRLQVIQHSEDQQHEADIARLNKEAGGARQAAAGANERAARAEKEAAASNEKAEQEHLARVKIEEKLAPRRLTVEQRNNVAGKLRAFAGQKSNLYAYVGDPESITLANDILAAVGRGGLGSVRKPRAAFLSDCFRNFG